MAFIPIPGPEECSIVHCAIGEGGTCARFGGFRKIADIPGLLYSLLAKEESKLYVEI